LIKAQLQGCDSILQVFEQGEVLAQLGINRGENFTNGRANCAGGSGVFGGTGRGAFARLGLSFCDALSRAMLKG
jgi:hypothetical protein